MNQLNNITIVSICHNDKFKSTIQAMDYSMSQIGFVKSLIITEDKLEPAYRRMLSHKLYPNINVKTINKTIDLREYNRMCIEDLHSYIDTEYCLLIQWDGFVIDANRWQDKFLEYDYVGAPWNVPKGARNNIGNGGFSLRSKKFLEVSSQLRYDPDNCEWLHPSQKLALPIAPEDWYMCYSNYKHFSNENINFPDTKTAYKFSVEHSSSLQPFNPFDVKTYKSFGFHGEFNEAAMEILNVRQ